MPVAMSLISNLFSLESIRTILLMALVYCIAVSMHETAHGWIAYKLGDDTAYLQGRLTLNPLAHIDPIGLVCFVIGGIGWAKPVPINPTRFDRKHTMKKGIVLTSLAGPLTNMLLAIVSNILFFALITIFALTGVDSVYNMLTGQAGNVGISLLLQFFRLMITFNFILMIFNLLPIPPLDGYKIFGAILPDRIYYKLMNYERIIGMAFLLIVLFGRGILSSVISVVSIPFQSAIFNPLSDFFTWLWQILGII